MRIIYFGLCALSLQFSAQLLGQIAPAQPTVFTGTVQKVETIDDPNQNLLTDNLVGAAVGAGVGGVAGGKIADSPVGALVGVLAGGLIGAVAQQQIQNKQVKKYTIAIDNPAQSYTLIQPLETQIDIGVKVMLWNDPQGNIKMVAQ
jgi:outer membrane lipoprotein SlyB